MKKIFWGVIILGAIYCAYWTGIKFYAPNAAPQILSDMRADGIEITTTQPLDIHGFPANFDSALGRLSYASLEPPNVRAVFENAKLSVKAYYPLSQKLTHNGDGALSWDISRMSLSGRPETLRASAHFTAENITARNSKGLTGNQLNIDISDLEFLRSENIDLALKSIKTANIRRSGSADNYTLTLSVQDAQLHTEMIGPLGNALGDVITQLSGTVAVSEGLNEFTQTTLINALSSQDCALKWGAADIGLSFDIARNTGGLQGEITLMGQDSAALLRALRDAGLIDQGQLFTIGLAIGAGSDKQQSLSLQVKDSFIFYGPLPIAPLPL